MIIYSFLKKCVCVFICLFVDRMWGKSYLYVTYASENIVYYFTHTHIATTQADDSSLNHITTVMAAAAAVAAKMTTTTTKTSAESQPNSFRQTKILAEAHGNRCLHIDYLGTIILQINSSAVVVKWTHTSSTYAVLIRFGIYSRHTFFDFKQVRFWFWQKKTKKKHERKFKLNKISIFFGRNNKTNTNF